MNFQLYHDCFNSIAPKSFPQGITSFRLSYPLGSKGSQTIAPHGNPSKEPPLIGAQGFWGGDLGYTE